MSRATYYSPFMLGFGLGVLVPILQAADGSFSAGHGWLRVAFVPLVLLNGITTGVNWQLIMIGFQGVFAQVVPAFQGRSIRDAGAVAIGAFILIGMGLLGALSIGFWLLGAALTPFVWILIGISLGSLVTALLIFLWCLPLAVQDFGKD